MKSAELTKFLAVVAIVVLVCGYYITPLALSVKQGLDLQGGTHVVLEAVDTPEAKVDEDAVKRVLKIIEKRINELGLTEPVIQRQGERRIIIELPGVKDPEKAIEMIGKTALMEFQDEKGVTHLTGKDLKDARAQIDQSKQNLVALEFTDQGGKIFGELTSKNVGKQIAILLDKQVLTSPVVNEPILGGKAVITGNRSIEEAERLAILLRSGSLPVKVEVLETRTVGPSLGDDSKEKSKTAFLVSIVAIAAFMLIYYRMSGFVADVTLLLYIVLTMFCMKMLNATLTLPGIAGIILSMGMAVDANVLIFERIREELANGVRPKSAIVAGFDRAYSSIFDANITTLLVAFILFAIGTGPIKGFAITLAIGIVSSLFTAILVTRALIQIAYGKRKSIKRLSIG